MSIKALGSLQLPSQKEFAAGLGGLAAFAIIAGFQLAGVTLSDTVDTLLIVALPPIIAKLVPASDADKVKGLNDDIVAAGIAIGNVSAPADLAEHPALADIAGPNPYVAQPPLTPYPGPIPNGPVNASDAPVQAGPNTSGLTAVDQKRSAEVADPLAHYKPPISGA